MVSSTGEWPDFLSGMGIKEPQQSNDYDVDWFGEPVIERAYPVYTLSVSGIDSYNVGIAETILRDVFGDRVHHVETVLLECLNTGESRMNVNHWEIADDLVCRFQAAMDGHRDGETLGANLSMGVAPNSLYCSVKIR